MTENEMTDTPFDTPSDIGPVQASGGPSAFSETPNAASLGKDLNMINTSGASATGVDFCIDKSAVDRIRDILVKEKNPNLSLRVSVSGGGCSGFQYHYKLDDAVEESDIQYNCGDITVIVDDVSLDFLRGATLMFKRDLMGAYFSIDNPQATSSCGCGASFSI